MARHEQLTLSPFDFPDAADPKNAGKPRFDGHVAMIATAHEHAAVLRFLARKAQEELLATDETQLPKHVIKFGPNHGRSTSRGTVSAIANKLIVEADEWDRVGRELFNTLPKRVAERLTLPDREREVASVVRVGGSVWRAHDEGGPVREPARRRDRKTAYRP